MKKTVDAIKYGLETLNITPKAMFSLIESSKGYDGEDYSRWLVNEIIKIAEKDGVGYSQLLAKWFNIIQGIIEEHLDESISDEFKELVKKMLKGKVYAYGIPEDKNDYGEALDIDWSKGLDLPYNCEFVESLPDEVRGLIEDGKEVTFLIRLGVDGKMTGSPLISDAKSNGVILKSYDALLIYRICSMYRALGDEASNLSFVIIGNTNFFYNPDNTELVKYFLSFTKYSGFAVDSKDLYEKSYTNESYAILKCSPLGMEDKIQDGIVLPKILKGGIESETLRYSKGTDMWSTLLKDAGEPKDTVYSISEAGRIVSTQLSHGSGLGYLCNSTHLSSPVISTCPIAGSDSIGISSENFYKCIAYYGVVTSLRGQRLSSDITDIITGNPEYMNLVGNCLPLVLFDINNYWGTLSGEVDGQPIEVRVSTEVTVPIFEQFIRKEIEALSVYFSYEAKELMDLGMKIWRDAGKRGMTFGEAFKAVDREKNHSVDKDYLNAVSRCQTYVCSLYKAIQ